MSSSSTIPYIGSKISLVTNSELRYEGTLININTTNSTVTLRDVRMSGTENRKAPQFVLPSSEVFDFIIFNGKDIKDLTVSEPVYSVKEDPAVVAVNVAPTTQQQMPSFGAGPRGGGPGVNDPLAAAGYHDGSMMYPRGPHPMANVDGYPRGFSPLAQRGGNGMFGRGGRDYYGYGGGYGGPRGFGRGGPRVGGPLGNTNNPRSVVGELSAQPNTSLKTQVAQAFDFEQNNSKFEKEKTELQDQNKPVAQPYDKKASFFDNISCETLNRQHGRDSKLDREKQRELDAETFGPAATLTRGPRYYRRGFRRSAGGNALRGGRGGYGGMYGPGRMMGPGFYGPANAFGLGPNQMLRAQ